jgi:hypothetical protein
MDIKIQPMHDEGRSCGFQGRQLSTARLGSLSKSMARGVTAVRLRDKKGVKKGG